MAKSKMKRELLDVSATRVWGVLLRFSELRTGTEYKISLELSGT